MLGNLVQRKMLLSGSPLIWGRTGDKTVLLAAGKVTQPPWPRLAFLVVQIGCVMFSSQGRAHFQDGHGWPKRLLQARVRFEHSLKHGALKAISTKLQP